jgi:hypothetical protein
VAQVQLHRYLLALVAVAVQMAMVVQVGFLAAAAVLAVSVLPVLVRTAVLKFTGGEGVQMRAAQIDANSIVINYAEVGGFDAQFIDPMNSVLGAFWNGTSFVNPTPPGPDLSANAPIITDSFNASLRRKAVKLQAQGSTFEAVQLLLQAQGVQS